ncbi:hypothetical protein ACSQ6I_24475 [Anabaena sp. WFMT]|uniref:hypothetical protein n=1 Tax=Anabaena sp. WFMT TaxID=3449730 RepID=UPI003F24BE27
MQEQHEIASDWDTDAEQLANLAQSRWDCIRLAVSKNPSTPEETLLVLAEDKVLKIRLAVAKNSVTSAQILAVLAASDQEIQAAVARHENTTEEILDRLFATQHRVIKSRSNLPASILERIFHESPKASQTPLFLIDHGAFLSLFLRQINTPTWILAEFCNIDIEALIIYALDKQKESPIVQSVEEWLGDRSGRLADVAKHPQVSVEILERLAEYPNASIQLAVALNQKTAQSFRNSLLRQLVFIAEDYIKVRVAGNPQTPIEILELLSRISSSFNTMEEMLRQISRDVTPNLINRIKAFIDRHQSPELILFWLQQDPAFQTPILNEWDELITSLNNQEKETLENIANQESSDQWQGKFTVERKDCPPRTSSRYDNLEPNHRLLYRLLYLLNMSYNKDVSNQEIIAALLGNPSTPETLRELLWQKYRKEPDSLNRHSGDASLRLALGFNSAVPELERQEYLQQALFSDCRNIQEAIAKHPDTPVAILKQIAQQAFGGLQQIAKHPDTPVAILEQIAQQAFGGLQQIAKHPNTPVAILEQIAQQGVGGLQQIVENPNAPVHLLEQAVEQMENSSGLSYILIDVAENPNTPIVLLKQLALNKGKYGVAEAVLKNPHLDHLNKYKIQLELQKREEASQATQLLASRPNSPHALAQVLETGDQKAKLSAARSNKTPIHILERLAKDSDATIRQVVSQNRNLPLRVLLDLTQDENLDVRLNLVHNTRNQSIEILERLAHDESDLVRLKVAGNANTPVEILTQLAQDSSKRVCKRLTENENTPVEVLEFLGVEKKIANAHNPKTPGNALAAVVEDTLKKDSQTQKEVFEFLLRNGSQMPASTLEKLATNTNSWIRSKVANHRNTPTSALEKMVDDSYIPVLWGIAGNPNTTPEILERLINRQDISPSEYIEQIYATISQRQDIPINLMGVLLSSPWSSVRRYIVYKNNLPTELVERLIATEPDESVLISLAHNPNLTPELLTQLIQHSNSNVRNVLVDLVCPPNLTEAHWQQLAQDEALPVREAVAASENVPAQVLEFLSTDEKVEVRLKVATNSRTPESALAALTRDEDLTIRAAVATNPNLPSVQLEQLAQDEKVEVRRAVAKNPHTPALVRASLEDLVSNPTVRQTQTSPTLRGLSRIYNPQTDDLATVLSEYVESDVPFVRLVALLHPLTSAEILRQGAHSASWLERYAVADNPATPTEIKQQLTEDSNQIVRAVAIASLN